MKANYLTSGGTKSCGCAKNQYVSSPRNTSRTLSQYKTGSKKRGISWEISDADAITLLKSPCYYCGEQLLCDDNESSNGIDRIDNASGYSLDNTVSCCFRCNIGKGTRTRDEFLDWIVRVYNKSFPKSE